MSKNMKNSTKIQSFAEHLKEQGIEGICRLDKINIVPADGKNCGFEEKDVYILQKKVEKDGEEKTIFEFYKDNELIAIADENGNIEYTEKYKLS